MIPRTLQIKNFLSYGTDCPPISFEQHALICLSGNNGHGKSALLDAITWAVWGSARKNINSSRADLGLLRLGQSSMMVIFDFSVHNSIYRIKREFELVYGKQKNILDIGIVHPDGTIHSLTEKTMRDTQERIEKIIGLDYETFVNSSFLRQGNANEFSKRSSKERKEIIGAILGLGLYDNLKKAALEKIKITQQEMTNTKVIVDHAYHEKERLLGILSNYDTFRTQLDTINHEYHLHKEQLSKIRDQIAYRETQKQLLTHRIKEYADKKIKYEATCVELRKIRAAWRLCRATIADHAQYTRIRHELQTKEKLYATAQTEIASYVTIKEHIQTWEKKETDAKHALTHKKLLQESERTVLLERLDHTLKTIKDSILHVSQENSLYMQELETIRKKIDQQSLLQQQLAKNIKNLQKHQKQFEKRKEAYHRWTTLGNIIRNEHGTQLQKIALANDHTNPSCPLCEQSLSAARKRFLQKKISDTLSLKIYWMNRFKHLLPKLKKILIEDHATIQTITQQQHELHTLEHVTTLDNQKALSIQETIKKSDTHLIQLHEQEKQITTQKESLVRSTSQHADTPDIIALKTEIQQCTEQITMLTTQLAALSYNPTTVTQLHTEIQQLYTELNLYEEQQKNSALQETRKQSIINLCAELKQTKLILLDEKKYHDELVICTQMIEQLQKEMILHTQEEQTLHALREKLLIEQGSYRAAQETVTVLEKKILEQAIILEKKQSVLRNYQTIAAAVGKDGIQAILIEEAIPEIEEKANELLAKLTNNNAHIIIDSLRDLKNGGTKETLDIKISDAQGIRPYEMFSGGEAFRIDFSLRIAISKLLAHRAGTALQTLIIDEGFGSQDDEGLATMMELLKTLQDEFAKIIVVSHLPTLKDQFPVHFHVEKTPHGSMVHIIEQG